MPSSFIADEEAAQTGAKEFVNQGGKVVAKTTVGANPGSPLDLRELLKEATFKDVYLFENVAVWSTVKEDNIKFRLKGSCSPRL